MIAHDEKDLVRAIQSLLAQKDRPYRVWLHDNGTSDSFALAQIEESRRLLSEAGINCIFSRSEENLRVGAVRARIYHQIRASKKIDLVTCLDGDDEFGCDVLAAMQATYQKHRGELDVIVPSEIAYRYDSDVSKIVPHPLIIPPINSACPNAPADKVMAWIRLTQVGATFAIRVAALARYNGFSKQHRHDEWVWKLIGWGRQRARFVQADITAVGSYQYWQHDLRIDPHAERRQLHAFQRFKTARAALNG